MTSRCLWHACRALALGLLLMLIGAGMATIGQWNTTVRIVTVKKKQIQVFFWFIGYYAEHISSHTETRNNSTVRVKPDSKGIHLHNLSYAGPIVMGCGGKKILHIINHTRNLILQSWTTKKRTFFHFNFSTYF